MIRSLSTLARTRGLHLPPGLILFDVDQHLCLSLVPETREMRHTKPVVERAQSPPNSKNCNLQQGANEQYQDPLDSQHLGPLAPTTRRLTSVMGTRTEKTDTIIMSKTHLGKITTANLSDTGMNLRGVSYLPQHRSHHQRRSKLRPLPRLHETQLRS